MYVRMYVCNMLARKSIMKMYASICVYVCMCACMYVRMRGCLVLNTNSYTCIKRNLTGIRVRTCMYARMYVWYVCMYACMIHACMHVCMLTSPEVTLFRQLVREHLNNMTVCRYKQLHVHTHTYIHAYIHTHTHTHTHIHSYMHTYLIGKLNA